jgi:hypothetical protein
MTPQELESVINEGLEHPRDKYEVSPRGFGLFGWKLVNVSEDERWVIGVFNTKQEAVSYARQYMWDKWRYEHKYTELSIKNIWGRIAEKNTYPRFSDPPETKG